MTLTEFLLARIAEDEVVAAEAKAKGPKRVVDGWSTDLYPGWDGYEVIEDDGRDLWTHVSVGWDRLLAECAAKRAIIEQFIEAESSARAYRSSAASHLAGMNDQDKIEWKKAEARLGQMEIVVRFMVEPHVGHPDFGRWASSRLAAALEGWGDPNSDPLQDIREWKRRADGWLQRGLSDTPASLDQPDSPAPNPV